MMNMRRAGFDDRRAGVTNMRRGVMMNIACAGVMMRCAGVADVRCYNPADHTPLSSR